MKTDSGITLKKILFAVISVLLLILVFFVVIIINRKKVASGISEQESVSMDSELEQGEEIEYEEIIIPEEPNVSSEDDELHIEYNEDIYVAVPADYLSLRESPGLGEDVVEKIYAGELLQMNGESVFENEMEYYPVKQKNGELQGYVSAAYCTPVSWLYEDMEELDIVDVSNAIYSYDSMVEDIQQLCNKYADLLSYETVGESVDGRKIIELHLGNIEADKHIFIDASIHGREYITSMLVMKLVEYYASQYKIGGYNGIPYETLLDAFCFDILPMVNPDGVSISQYGEEALHDKKLIDNLRSCYERDREYLVYKEDGAGSYVWSDYYKEEDFDRSTMDEAFRIIRYDEYLQQWKSNANGIDINDNFNVGWNEANYKRYSSYGMSKGFEPESEPETKVLMKESQDEDYCCYINYHSRGQLIYYDSFGMSDEQVEDSFSLASDLESIIRYKVTSTKSHETDRAGFGDWVHVSLGKPGVTIEMGKTPSPVSISEFPGIWARNRESWAYLCSRYM